MEARGAAGARSGRGGGAGMPRPDPLSVTPAPTRAGSPFPARRTGTRRMGLPGLPRAARAGHGRVGAGREAGPREAHWRTPVAELWLRRRSGILETGGSARGAEGSPPCPPDERGRSLRVTRRHRRRVLGTPGRVCGFAAAGKNKGQVDTLPCRRISAIQPKRIPKPCRLYPNNTPPSLPHHKAHGVL